MFADLMNKIACRTFAILFFFLGGFSCAMGAIAIAWAFGSSPSDLAEIEKTLGMPIPPEFLALFGGAFIAFGAILIALGVFARLRHLWALIVGSAMWILMATSTPTGDKDTFSLVMASVFVLLTLIAIIGRWRSRVASQQTA